MAGFLLPALGLMSLAVAAILWNDDHRLAVQLGLGSLPLLAVGWPLVRRGMLPMLAVLTPTALRLEPRGRTAAYGWPVREYPLTDFEGYSDIQAQNGTDVTNVKLFFGAAGTVYLGDRPAKAVPAAEASLPNLVTVLALGEAMLGQKAETGVPAENLYRPNFYQRGLGRALAWLCYALMALGVLLLFVPGVEWTASLRLFTFTALYLGLYRRNQRATPAA
ncbi:hypothetical protein [Hymenobacter armeniacus]|nr:hypothetical protein [Hymenobacter armeniacus]